MSIRKQLPQRNPGSVVRNFTPFCPAVASLFGGLLLFLVAPVRGEAPTGEALTDAEIARETSDPGSDLWYLYTLVGTTFQPQKSFREGGSVTLELQPSLPVPLGRALGTEWRALNFPDLILGVQGTPGGGVVTGVESLSWITAFSPEKKILGLTVGLGPALSFPVSTDAAFGPAAWQFGIGGVLVRRTENFIASALVKSVWSTSDSGGGFLQVQYNLQYFLGQGW
jgi:hypothetical protein